MTSLESRIAKLSQEQRQVLGVLLEKHGEQLSTVAREQPVVPDLPGRQQLVAYVVIDQGTDDISQLRRYAEQNLPEPMRPVVYIEVDSMPRLDNGKLNFSALPDPGLLRSGSARKNQVTPVDTCQSGVDGKTISTLVGILAELIGMEDIRPEDNFFEIGGDSITAIQLVSRAREVGIQLSVASITSTPDIGSLATAVQNPLTRRTDVSAYGSTPLTPIQNWFFAHRHPQPEHWNLGGVMTFKQSVKADRLLEAIKSTIRGHAAMSTRFQQDDGVWSAVVQEGDLPADMVEIAKEQHGGSDEDCFRRMQARFILDAGWLAGFTIVVEPETGGKSAGVNDLQHNRAVRLYWTMHHLICDGLSVQLILDNIRTGYQQLVQSGSIRTSALQPGSYREWALALQARRLENIGQETQTSIKTETVDPELTPAKPQEQACTSLSKNISGSMVTSLATANEAYGTSTHELLLAALTVAWSTISGLNAITIDIETHGRDVLDTDIENSGVVGWFTSYFPFTAEISHLQHVGSRIKHVKEAYRKKHEIDRDYLLMRYGKHPLSTEIDCLPDGSVNLLFNFINYASTSGGGADMQFWNAGAVSPDWFRSPLNYRSHVLELNIIAAPENLTFNFRFVRERVSQSQIENLYQVLQEELQAIVKHCNAADSTGYTPSDFPELDMEQDDLDDFLESITVN